MKKQWLIRKHRFCASHRVMHESVQCWSNHGHDYFYEVKIMFNEIHSLGYAIDFKEVRRLFLSFMDERFDHGSILNPHDTILIEALSQIKHPITEKSSKLHLMNLMGQGEFCNPSAENISKEVFFAAQKLLDDPDNCGLKVVELKLWETPNCWVECTEESLSKSDYENLEASQYARDLEKWKLDLGTLEYDSRKR